MRSMRNVRRSPERSSSATTYQSPRSLNTRRGRDRALGDLVARRRPVAHRAAARRAAAAVDELVDRSASSAGVDGEVDDDGVVAERGGELLPARARAGPPGRRPGSCIAARPAATRAKPSGAVSRSGRVNSRGTPTNDRVVVDEHVDHLVDERRQPAHRRQLEVGGDLARASCRTWRATSASGTSPPLHQPRQHHEQPAAGAPRRRSPRRVARSSRLRRRRSATAQPRRRRRRARPAAPSTSACSSSPSTHERNAAHVGARHVDLDRPVAPPRRTTRSLPSSRSTSGGPRRRRCARAPSTVAVAVDAELLGVGRERRRAGRTRPGARTRRPRRRRRRRPRCGRRGTCAARRARGRGRATYQNPSRSSRPYGSTRRPRPAVARTSTTARRAAASRSTGSAGSSGTLGRHRRRRRRARRRRASTAPARRRDRAPGRERTAATATCSARVSSGSRSRSASS